ncbi:hypothetical protein LINPERPRIM_LOCUS14062 [Linum perenne]
MITLSLSYLDDDCSIMKKVWFLSLILTDRINCISFTAATIVTIGRSLLLAQTLANGYIKLKIVMELAFAGGKPVEGKTVDMM